MLQAFAEAVREVVVTLGYPGLFLMIVLESTLVPIPSLLVMPYAGYLAHRGDFSLPVILIINSAGALVGSGLSYWLGTAGGKPLLLKYGKYFMIKPHDIERTEQFFARYGAWTIFIARFLPVIRHIISIPAGVARMPLPQFFALTFLGASLWGGGLMVLGYQLGASWEGIAAKAKRVDLVIAALIVVGLVAVGLRFYLKRRKQAGAVTSDQPTV